MKIFYECNKEKCIVCQCNITGCHLTSNIEYAKNFEKCVLESGEVYYEEIKEEEENELEEH